MPPVLGEAKEGKIRAAPAFSITGRGKDIEEKTPMPGPGTYSPASSTIVKRPPAFTMAPRRERRAPTAAVPGPDVYCPEKVIHHTISLYEGRDCFLCKNMTSSPKLFMDAERGEIAC